MYVEVAGNLENVAKVYSNRMVKIGVRRTSKQISLFGLVAARLSRVLPGLTSQSKGRAARWRF